MQLYSLRSSPYCSTSSSSFATLRILQRFLLELHLVLLFGMVVRRVRHFHVHEATDILRNGARPTAVPGEERTFPVARFGRLPIPCVRVSIVQ